MKDISENLKKSELYSEELGIELRKGEVEWFKWFLASLLFGGRITETIARNTYRSFQHYDLLTPEEILEAGWDFLVNPVMRRGGYVRYDEMTSTQILKNMKTLFDEYNGCLENLHAGSKNSRDLEYRLMAFYRIGPVTMNIFLREMRPFWLKADPEPLPVVKELAEMYAINLDSFERKSIEFVRTEAGLIRIRKQLKKLNREKLSK